MNLVLFEDQEAQAALAFNDPRAKHIRKILKLGVGEQFRSGLVDGPLGYSTILRMEDQKIYFRHEWHQAAPAPFPIHLICGTPRPNSAKRMLRDATCMGVASLTFIDSDLGEKSYRDSHVWEASQVRELLKQGASQTYTTRLPKVQRGLSLRDAHSLVLDSQHIAFDNNVHARSFKQFMAPTPSLASSIYIGSERGWSDRERQLMAELEISSYLLGSRVMRSDTAFIAALTLVAQARGLLEE
ncbi:RsmE family RNA methyltransferase [Pseudobacteriovorax antillogorgiicola]|uniref:Ribosomal RNA small subunit methyltransferase E n=1 Tax=Pseudobacteriovorax antillogorgiicola TaxID=1513793 RepID=A0A1Y6BL05_9BACT|nr:RsmE family RNA methyltransferase [Pseudobacteriovorax antillogorgiicola]TCS56246.1 RsmE family RNA methyltransferase [Pseudobacteriovorax antillogorgiicola]SMF08061.1 RNA methyltransferase, RsmE family [Pseudobacteriovorax antillogorgiicola]